MTAPRVWNERSGGQRVSLAAAGGAGVGRRRISRKGAVTTAPTPPLAGKRCLVTGGSRGLGLALGLAFARARRARRLHLPPQRGRRRGGDAAPRRCRRRAPARVPRLGRRRRARAAGGQGGRDRLGRPGRAGQQRRHQPDPPDRAPRGGGLGRDDERQRQGRLPLLPRGAAPHDPRARRARAQHRIVHLRASGRRVRPLRGVEVGAARADRGARPRGRPLRHQGQPARPRLAGRGPRQDAAPAPHRRVRRASARSGGSAPRRRSPLSPSSSCRTTTPS